MNWQNNERGIFMIYKINMLSQAAKVKGQGVLSAYEEQVSLVKEELNEKFIVVENKWPDADITHYHTVNLRYFLSIPFAKRNGVTVGYVHFLPETVDTSLQLPKICKKVFYKYLIWFYKSMDYLVTVNPYFIERLGAYGVDTDKVTYIPNYVSDTQFFPIEDENKQNLREKYGLDKDKFTVLCAGQLQTRKGIFDFIEIARQMPHMQFVWAGGFSFGKMTDGYKEIKEVVDNPPPNLKFLGIIDRELMNEIYNLGDVMFLPSFEELFPMTILEAMNCRTPILLRDIDIYKNILFDFYVKGNNVEGFKILLDRLASDETFYKMAVDKAWEGHLFYHRDHVSQMWDAFYTEIAPKAKPFKLKALLNRFGG